jgi:hypothetical protein
MTNTRKFRLCGLITTLFVIVLVFGSWIVLTSNRLIVRNDSGQPLQKVSLVLRDTRGTMIKRKTNVSLESGKTIVIRHRRNDSNATLSFELAGKTINYEEGYIDLWTGEGWILNVQPGGVIQGKYEYGR